MQRVLALATFLVVILTGIVAWASLRLNLGEVAWQLQKQEFVEGNLSRMYLIARFVDQRKLYLQEMDRGEFDRNEFEISRIMKQQGKRQLWIDLKVRDALDHISLTVVNRLRNWIGKSPLADLDEINSLGYLEHAFRMERAREYQKALDLYSIALPMIKDPALIGVIQLHQGYCNALLGKIEEARALYSIVIREQRNNEQGVTAGLLLEHLNQIIAERQVLSDSKLTSMEKATKAALLLQCPELLTNLRKDSPEKDIQDRANLQFVRGVCEEELGNKTMAIKSYLSAIKMTKDDSLARDANRRLYMVGSQIRNGKQITNFTQKLNKALGDTILVKMREDLERQVEDTSINNNLTQLNIPSQAILEINQEAQSILLARLASKKRYSEDSPKRETQPVPVNTPTIHSYTKVLLKNGKSFSGEVLSSPEEKVLRLKTMIGIIGIRKSDIKTYQTE